MLEPPKKQRRLRNRKPKEPKQDKLATPADSKQLLKASTNKPKA